MLQQVGSKSYVKLYKGADHGWTTRYDLEDPETSKRANSAHEELISWYKRMLKPEEGGANLQEEWKQRLQEQTDPHWSQYPAAVLNRNLCRNKASSDSTAGNWRLGIF